MSILGHRLPKRVVVNLLGGLGNQLFCYALGQYLTRNFGIHVSYDSYPGHLGANHGFTLAGRNLPGNFISRRKENLGRLLASASIQLQEKHPKLRTLLPPLTGGQYCSSVELPILRIAAGGTIQGYFQTFRYVSELPQTIVNWQSILPKNGPSDWFKDQSVSLGERKSIALHLRRTDYTKHSQTAGLLTSDYYRLALEKLPSKFDSSPVWVFPDDPEIAEQELAGIERNLHFVKPPEGSDAAESLSLMSQASAILLANSTFSWWAGALAAKTTPVVIPQPWFRTGTKPELVIPGWIKAEARFR